MPCLHSKNKQVKKNGISNNIKMRVMLNQVLHQKCIWRGCWHQWFSGRIHRRIDVTRVRFPADALLGACLDLLVPTPFSGSIVFWGGGGGDGRRPSTFFSQLHGWHGRASLRSITPTPPLLPQLWILDALLGKSHGWVAAHEHFPGALVKLCLRHNQCEILSHCSLVGRAPAQ